MKDFLGTQKKTAKILMNATATRSMDETAKRTVNENANPQTAAAGPSGPYKALSAL